MRINLLKTKIMVFRNGGYLRENGKRYFEDQRIDAVSAYRYIGIKLTPKLIWTPAKSKLANQVNRDITLMLKNAEICRVL